VSDRNYIILCMTYAAVEIPCVLIVIETNVFRSTNAIHGHTNAR